MYNVQSFCPCKKLLQKSLKAHCCQDMPMLSLCKLYPYLPLPFQEQIFFLFAGVNFRCDNVFFSIMQHIDYFPKTKRRKVWFKTYFSTFPLPVVKSKEQDLSGETSAQNADMEEHEMNVRSSLSSGSHALCRHDRQERTSAVLSATETPGDSLKNTQTHSSEWQGNSSRRREGEKVRREKRQWTKPKYLSSTKLIFRLCLHFLKIPLHL